MEHDVITFGEGPVFFFFFHFFFLLYLRKKYTLITIVGLKFQVIHLYDPSFNLLT